MIKEDKWKNSKIILDIAGERHRMIYDRTTNVLCEDCSMNRHCAERPDDVLRPCPNSYAYFVKEEPNNK